MGPFGVGRVALDVAARGHVADGVVAREDQSRDDDEQRVLAEQLHDRHLRLLLARGEFGEHGALFDVAAHVVADEDQHDAEQERDAPAPGEELIPWRDRCHDRHDARRQQQPERDADLRRGSEDAALALGGVLDGHQYSTAPLATGRDALQDAQQHEHDRGADADDLGGGQHTDQRGGRAHQDERPHQHALAAELVAEVTGEECAQRPEQEADAHGREPEDDGVRAECGEEQLAEHESDCGCVDEEVVPLDGGSHDRGEHHASPVCGTGDGAGRREAGLISH